MANRPVPIVINDSALEYARNNLNETETSRIDAVKEVREWLDEKFHFDRDDDAILPFLRGCKYDLEKTKRKLENYYAMKRTVPEWFANRDPSLRHLQELIKMGVFVPLDGTHEEKTVIVARVAAHDPKIYKIDDVIKVGLMILDVLAMENQLLQIYGVIAIFDLANVSFEHAKQLTPSLIGKIVNAWENYHCRPKQLEFLNAPFYVNVVLRIFKSFMSEKMRQRIRVHSYGVQYAADIVSPEILPVEYGGTAPSIFDSSEMWANKVMGMKEWFEAEEVYK